MRDDIRWKQRFQNYVKALNNMTEAIDLTKQRSLSDLEKKGLIQDFEIVIELAWNVMKDYLSEQGERFTDINSPKSAVRTAFRKGIIHNGDLWIQMLLRRNETSHTYNAEILNDLFSDIINDFYPEFIKLSDHFNQQCENT